MTQTKRLSVRRKRVQTSTKLDHALRKLRRAIEIRCKLTMMKNGEFSVAQILSAVDGLIE